MYKKTSIFLDRSLEFFMVDEEGIGHSSGRDPPLFALEMLPKHFSWTAQIRSSNMYKKTSIFLDRSLEFFMVDEEGIEPSTYGLRVRRSNQLSYSSRKSGRNIVNSQEKSNFFVSFSGDASSHIYFPSQKVL